MTPSGGRAETLKRDCCIVNLAHGPTEFADFDRSEQEVAQEDNRPVPELVNLVQRPTEIADFDRFEQEVARPATPATPARPSPRRADSSRLA
jgi:hypothetical protein